MIDLNLILLLLNELRAEALESVVTPTGRDAFAFGAVHGQLRVIEEFRARLEAKIEEIHQGNHEDN